MSGLHTSHRITWSLVWATLVSCMSTLQFGFHLAVFNAPQEILSCRKSIAGPFPSYENTLWSHLNTVQCIPMSLESMASINTMFTVGGLLSSIVVGSHAINGAFGRKVLQKISALLFFCGSVLVCFANSVLMLNTGRFFAGLGAGSCMVMAPILISELAPFNHRGLLGSLLQFGVGIGILMAQLIAFQWGNDQQWRNLFLTGALLGFLQFFLLFTTVESPKWLIIQRGDISNASEILHALRTSKLATRHEIDHYRSLSVSSTGPAKPISDTSYLLGAADENAFDSDTNSVSGESMGQNSPTFSQYIFDVKYRKEWVAVVLIMSAQQLCGMNAITFYGVSVLSNVVPRGTNVLYLTLSLALTNVAAALGVCPFIDRWGRKPFLLTSVSIMTACSVVISTGLTRNMDYVAAAGCFGFVIGYSIGLGQIPFLMVSEFSSHEVVGLAQSLGTTCNWMANICIAFLFPRLREVLGGLVFYVFFALGVLFFGAIFLCVPETRGMVEYEEIWGHHNS